MMGKKDMSQFARFAIVGVINTLVNLVVLYVLTEFFGVYYLASAVFAFMVAVTNSFIMNTLWTFNQRINHDPAKRYTKFIIVSVAALLINLVSLYLLTEYLGFWYMFSQIIAILLSLWVNYFGNKFWTYNLR